MQIPINVATAKEELFPKDTLHLQLLIQYMAICNFYQIYVFQLYYRNDLYAFKCVSNFHQYLTWPTCKLSSEDYV